MEEKLKSDEFLKTSNIFFLEENDIDVFEIKYLDTELKEDQENTEKPEMKTSNPPRDGPIEGEMPTLSGRLKNTNGIELPF